MSTKNKLSAIDQENFLNLLKERFEKNKQRHPKIEWHSVYERLCAYPEKIWSLHQMETTGGEPDLISIDSNVIPLYFFDCSAESPTGRRNTCYDLEGLESRKEHRPANNALDMANTMGIELLNESTYRQLQQFGKFDTKTSSWISTPHAIRKLGGALFADYRYGQVFIYHNGAQSYYAVRGFRGMLVV
jgi:Protein of unknown function (DUF4256)